MPPDTGPDYVDQRIAELYQQLDAIVREISELRAISRGEQPPPTKRRFTIIRGGAVALGAVIAGIGALVGRRPRHPVAISAALTAAGAAALVLAVPTYGSPPRRGMAIPPVFAVPGPPAPTPAVGSQPSTPGASGAAPQVQPWTPSAIPAEPVGATTAPASGPRGTGSASPSESAPASPPGTPGTPAPGPSTPYCLVTVIVPGVLDVCVL